MPVFEVTWKFRRIVAENEKHALDVAEEMYGTCEVEPEVDVDYIGEEEDE